jgi:hypothetical protein
MYRLRASTQSAAQCNRLATDRTLLARQRLQKLAQRCGDHGGKLLARRQDVAGITVAVAEAILRALCEVCVCGGLPCTPRRIRERRDEAGHGGRRCRQPCEECVLFGATAVREVRRAVRAPPTVLVPLGGAVTAPGRANQLVGNSFWQSVMYLPANTLAPASLWE